MKLFVKLRFNQIRDFVEVGQSINLEQRMAQHLPASRLHETVKTWGLVLSCMKFEGMPARVVSFPVLKVWEDHLLLYREILITMLCCGAVEDGGFNPKQAGTGANPTGTYTSERKQVFDLNKHLEENLAAEEKQAKERLDVLHVVRSFDSEDWGKKIHYLKTKLQQVQLTAIDARKTISER